MTTRSGAAGTVVSGGFSTNTILTAQIQASFPGVGALLTEALRPYLSPDADDADGGWTTDLGGTTLFSSVDEVVAADSDYIQSTDEPVADVCRFRLSDPSGTMAMPATVRIRAKRSGGGASNLITRLKEGTTTIATWTDNNISSTFTTYDHALLQAEFDAIGDKTNLFIELQADTATEAETTAWAAEVVTNGGTVSDTRFGLVNDLIAGLKTDGIFTKLDRLWLFAAENAGSALTDLVGLTLAAGVGGPIFTTDRGYSGGAVCINSNFNPTTASTPKYTQDSACLFAWNDAAISSFGGLFGISDSTSCRLQISNAGSFTYGINSSVGASTTTANQIGLMHINRSASSAQEAYKDGSSIHTAATASSSLVNANFAFLASGVAPSNPLPDGEVSCGGFGQSLNATEAGNLYTRLRTYMTAVGVP